MKSLISFSDLEKVKNGDRRIAMFYETFLFNLEARGFNIVKYSQFNNLLLGSIIEKNKNFEFNLLIERTNIIRISVCVDPNWLTDITLSRFDHTTDEWNVFFSSKKIFLYELDKKFEKINSLI